MSVLGSHAGKWLDFWRPPVHPFARQPPSGSLMRFGLPAFLLALVATLALAGCGQKKDDPMKSYDLSAKANTQFLADNKAKDGVKVTADGLQYRVIKSGH